MALITFPHVGPSFADGSLSHFPNDWRQDLISSIYVDNRSTSVVHIYDYDREIYIIHYNVLTTILRCYCC